MLRLIETKFKNENAIISDIPTAFPTLQPFREHRNTMRKNIIASCLMATCITSAASAIAEECDATDSAFKYPTTVIADYVLGCMAANGNSHQALYQCSCSIDYISERIPYSEYEKIATVMQVQMDRGQRGIFYRDSSWAKNQVKKLQKVQAESTLRCF